MFDIVLMICGAIGSGMALLLIVILLFASVPFIDDENHWIAL